MTTIPASLFVNVIPSVLGVGGQSLNLNGLVLTASNRVPIGSVYSFASAAAVATFFGSASNEAVIAGGGANKGGGYFAGFDNSDQLPGALLFAQYNATAVAAYLWGGASGLTLAAMQALSGSLNVTIDGYPHAIASINLSGYGSFSAAAAGIQAAFTDPVESSFTGLIGATFTGTQAGTNLTTTAVTGLISVGDTITGTGYAAGTKIVSQTSGTTGGAGVYVTNLSGTASSAASVGSSNVLDVTVCASPTIAAGQTLTGTSITAGTLITAQISGTAGGVGLYSISGSPQQIVSEAMTGVATAPLVTYDSTSGAFVITSGVTGAASTAAFATGTLAAPLFLTAATGAFLSQGAAAATPASAMNAIYAVTTNWFSYGTAFDPDGGSGNTVKLAFAAWKNTYPNRFMYVCWDTDPLTRSNPPQSTTLGALLTANGDSGTFLISELTDLNYMQFVMAIGASIDFTRTNGRVDYAFRKQAGLLADVTTGQVAVNLGGNPQVLGDFGNHYNYYGAIGAANAGFTWLQRGTITGSFKWADSYANQVWFNNLSQVALLSLFDTQKSIPFNVAGAGLIEQAMADPIAAGLNFRMFAPGTISASQIAQVNSAAGAQISDTLQANGYYLQVNQQSSLVRTNRGPWAITLWYLDRGSVQSISLSSVAVA